MTEQIGLWRATYTPGEWIVLGGPTSLVVLKPAATYLSALLEQLWGVVVAADSLDALVTELAKHNVSQMPDFAAFFWHGGSMRSLIRGEVEITDLDSGDTIADGADVQTWQEVGLGAVRRVRVELGAEASPPGSGLRLPLVVGAASAGSVELDATPKALVRSPQGTTAESPLGVAPVPVPIPGQPPIAEIESDRSAVVDAEVVEDHATRQAAGALAPIESGGSSTAADEAEPRAQPPSYAQPPTEAFDPFAQEDEAAQLFGQGERQPEEPFSPFDRAQSLSRSPSFGPQSFGPQSFGPQSFDRAGPIEAAVPPPIPPAGPEQPRTPADPHNPFVLPVVQDREDGSPREPFARGPQPQHPEGFGAPPDQQAPQEGMILGVTCAMGHPNPPDAQRCRRCGGPLQGQPRLMPQPVMVVLRPNNGQPVEVDRSVLIGRSPQPSKASGDESPRLMTVVSPSTDISRTHLQVSPAGWEAVATDLHSTNGTLLIRPGQLEAERLAPGEPVRIFPGCVLDLGDGVSIDVDHPA